MSRLVKNHSATQKSNKEGVDYFDFNNFRRFIAKVTKILTRYCCFRMVRRVSCSTCSVV